MTDEEFIAWLKNPDAKRVTLVEVDVYSGSEITRYLSTRGYNTGGADTPANQVYLPVITDRSLAYKESLSLQDGNDASLNVGDIEINNQDGALDSWFDDVWTNRSIKAYIGDPRWARADFRMIFNGITAAISSSSRGTINLKVTDKLQRLNTPLIETKLGGTTPNKDMVLPFCAGEAHNISPLLSNPVTLEYQFHAGATEGAFEVRDNGKPVSVTYSAATGKFTLNQASFGTITASVQGAKLGGTYVNTVAKVVEMMVTEYGKAADQFDTGDLDTAQLAAFNTAHPDPIGIYCGDRTNVLNACRDVASSVGAQLRMTRLGLLQLLQVDLASLSPTFTIEPKHMLQQDLRIEQVLPVKASVKLGFCPAYTIQNNLLTTIPDEHKKLFAQEWLVSVKTDATVQALYHLNAEPVQQDTYLLRRVEADVEAQRRLDLWKVQRKVYSFEGVPELVQQLFLGQEVTLQHPRFGLSGGVDGMVVSLEIDWGNLHVRVGVLA